MQTSDQGPEEHQSEGSRHLRLAVAPRAAQAAQAPTPVEQADAGGDLLDYVRVLHKRRWTAATAWSMSVH